MKKWIGMVLAGVGALSVVCAQESNNATTHPVARTAPRIFRDPVDGKPLPQQQKSGRPLTHPHGPSCAHSSTNRPAGAGSVR